MSVINETLDNLKQAKKRTVKSLDPSSSSYVERTPEKVSLMSKYDKSFIIPLGLTVLVGIFFSIYHLNPSSAAKNSNPSVANVLHANKEGAKPTNHAQAVIANPLAQSQYYTAMNLLNEGKEEQATLRLKEIIDQYPDFIPAQNVYSMLSKH